VKRGIALILILTAVQLFQPAAWAGSESLQTLETSCCLISYNNLSYLDDFNGRVGGYRYTSSGLNQDPTNAGARVGAIMSRVQETLDMYPEDFRITILLLPDYHGIEQIFRTFSMSGRVPLAFYSHKTRTIYVDVESVTEGVLAHEMAHAVINAYFPVPPPAKMQEILAQYVDLHVRD